MKEESDSGVVQGLAYARAMDTALALVRHGQTDWNLAGRMQGRTDIDLNDTGRAQARELGRELNGQNWDLVVASPLSRAQETALLIAAELDVEHAAPVADVIERGFGPLEGRIMAEVSEAEAATLAAETEDRETVLHRMLGALSVLVQENPGRKILVISHGAAMRIVRDALAGVRIHDGVANGELLKIDLERMHELREELGLVTAH
ncbi:histidine phosphatase family protein [Glutamicibacter sp. BW77]|uniref:histidine phosphatase family protein n=2 Tax=Micrococcaceae TaxID=1268 RepID=UPI00197AB9E3|nr:histidine phosphatase family protein [Glutamicibacter sp. BW77]